MTLPQILAFTIIFVMMALFAWGRLRYDLVAAVALMAAVIVGIVPPEQAFKGFSDDIVIIVGSALVVSAAVARSGVIERVARWLGPYFIDHQPADRRAGRLGDAAVRASSRMSARWPC